LTLRTSDNVNIRAYLLVQTKTLTQSQATDVDHKAEATDEEVGKLNVVSCRPDMVVDTVAVRFDKTYGHYVSW
jgi:hypothetical protein